MNNGREPIQVMALHALAYCERLFYMEEIEGIYLADERVYAGRTLHLDTLPDEPDIAEIRNLDLCSDELGLVGKVDAIRRRNGSWIPYEHKRGRAFKKDGTSLPWPADALQVAAYAMLLEEYFHEPITIGRIRYHADKVTLTVAIDSELRQNVLAAISRGRELATSIVRPPVSQNAGKCLRCAMAPECLPEEERLAREDSWDTVRLFPEKRDGTILHLIGNDLKVKRSGNSLLVVSPGREEAVYPIGDISALIIHGYGQITTQALYLCAGNNVPIHWLTNGGQYMAGLCVGAGRVQKRLRQYKALTDEELCLKLAKILVRAKAEGQLRFVLRSTRGTTRDAEIEASLQSIRMSLRNLKHASSIDELRGYEGSVARAYFSVLPRMLKDRAQPEMYPTGRSRRPPKDRFNALLSFGYALLYQTVLNALISVGLEPAIGFYHQPRSSAYPLVLDLMELFRVPIWDMTVIGSINRGQWDPAGDFSITGSRVWLSESGRAKAIGLYEERLTCSWKHPVTEYSLSYERTIELEARLLEKAWSGEPGLFALGRIR